MRGRGDDLRVADRRGMFARRDETREVRHVHQEQRADLVGDRAHARKIEEARIRRRARDDELGVVLLRETLELLVVDVFAVPLHAVRHEVVELGREVHRRAVREVAALIQRHPEHGVAGPEDRGVRGHVRLRSGVRLDVGVRGAEERLRALDCERLGDVDPLAAAVVATTRIALRVLVREDAADGLEHRGAGVVLGGDELDLLDLAAPLALDRRVQLRIGAFELAHVPLLIPCVPSANTGPFFSIRAICSRRRAWRPL